MSEKRQLRQQVKQLKQTISSEQRVALSQNICSAIEKLPGFETVSCILLYHALPDEVDTGLMLSRWSKKKQLYLPIVNGDNLIVSPYDPRFLKQGAFGIWEPGDTRETDPGSIDWIIVPGVAFDWDEEKDITTNCSSRPPPQKLESAMNCNYSTKYRQSPTT